MKDNKIVAFSCGAELISGYKAKEVLGLSVQKFFSEKLPKLSQEVEFETKIINKEKQLLLLRANNFPFKLNKSNHRFCVLTLEDLQTERRMRKYLYRVDRLKILGELTAGIIHEIRNPLASISTNVQYIRGNVEPGYEYWEEIQDISKDLAEIVGIIQKMLNFAKAGPSRSVDTDINFLIDEVLKFLKIRLRKQEISIQKNYASDLPLIPIDQEQIKQVFFNIILNACQAMTKGGQITITTRMGRTDLLPPAVNYVEVGISDNGSGIPTENLPRIFNPFFTTNPGGTGLGLAIAQRIIQTYKGTIEVKSTPGKGTKFTIKLPVRK